MTTPVVWVAFVLSLVIHVAVIGEWLPRVRPFAKDTTAQREASSLAVQLVAPAREPEAPVAAPTSTPSLASLQPPATGVRPPPRAPGATVPVVAPPPITPSPGTSPIAAVPVASPTVSPPAVPPTAAPIAGDLASYVEAQRRARGESETTASPADTPAVDADRARRERVAAANLAGSSASPLGIEPRHGGGLFQIKRMGYHDAEFIFFGWNREIERRIPQMIEVRQREHEDIQIAVVRKIIAIIREHEPADFGWESNRLGRRVVLSARARDNADLENFMMREFFGIARAPR